MSLPLALQISLDLCRRRKEIGKTRMRRPKKSPDDPKNQQAQNQHADTTMPIYQIAANLPR